MEAIKAQLDRMEARITALEEAISPEAKIARFEESFGSSPKPLQYTGKIESPKAGDKFVFADFTSIGGRIQDYSAGLAAKFIPDNPTIKALPEWYSSLDGLLGQGTETTLLAKTPGRHIIVVKYKGQVLDYIAIDSEIIDCGQCGG
jgi:hypothetical protein